MLIWPVVSKKSEKCNFDKSKIGFMYRSSGNSSGNGTNIL